MSSAARGRLGWLVCLLVAVAADRLEEHVAASSSNQLLACMTNYSLAVTPALARAPAACSWEHYAEFVHQNHLDWVDGGGGAAVRVEVGEAGHIAATHTRAVAELTSSLTTALTIIEALRLTLGDEAYLSRTEPLTVDVVGWAFHWVEREVEEGTSNTVTITPWEPQTAALTAVFWGEQIGGALRRMLPLVQSVSIRGIGPEAPNLAPIPLREDGWLTLELVNGVYDVDSPQAAQADLILLENSGMHDDLWPSDGGCVSDKGLFPALSGAELEARVSQSELNGLGLGCLWRKSIEAMIASGRTVWATSYQSHEHLLAVMNLLSVGARIVHAFPNGFAELISTEFDLLAPQGLLGEALRDPYSRGWSRAEALFAYTTAIWQYRIITGGFESVVHASRNSHVLAFKGPAREPPKDSTAHAAYEHAWQGANMAAAVQKRLREHACAAADLPTCPARQAEILKSAWFCGGKQRWPDAEPPPIPEVPPRSDEVAALCDSAAELAERGDASGAAETYREALALAPQDAVAWMALGVQLSTLDGTEEETLEAFETAVTVADGRDARPAITLGRYYAKISRPQDALSMFYAATAADVEYFEEAKSGAGTARAQQGRLREALADFEAASRLAPQNDRLRSAVASTAETLERFEAFSAGENAVADVCGTPCQDIVDASGVGVCAVTWEQGCGNTPPPPGFEATATVAELCEGACAFFNFRQQEGRT